MRFLMFIKHVENSHPVAPPKPLMNAMEAFVGEGFRTGWLKETGGLTRTSESVRIRSKDGALTVTDGPFAEAKEIVGGYAIVGNGGQESQCGWCKDRWGLSWQITPRVLTDALAAGGDEAKRAFEAMMPMKKIDIATIEAARRR